jgi:hypothetical protein
MLALCLFCWPSGSRQRGCPLARDNLRLLIPYGPNTMLVMHRSVTVMAVFVDDT